MKTREIKEAVKKGYGEYCFKQGFAELKDIADSVVSVKVSGIKPDVTYKRAA